MSGLEITHPWWLLIIVTVALLMVVLGARRSLVDMTSRQRWTSFLTRGLLLLSLALALAGVRALLPSKRLSVLFLVDSSASITQAGREQARSFVSQSLGKKGKDDLSSVVGFARTAELWNPAVQGRQSTGAWPEITDKQEKSATDFARALEYAAAVLPVDGARRVVLLTDGNDTSDRALAATRQLAGAGVELWTAPLRNDSGPEVLVESVTIPQRLKLGEALDLSSKIRSTVETPATVKLYQNGFLLEQREMSLKPGVNEFRAPGLHAEGSFVNYEVEVVAKSDTSVENNRASATASLRGQPKVLIVDSDERQTRPLAEALRGEKIAVETRGANGLPKSLEDLQQFDLFMLSDVPALRLGREQMELYRRWVQDFGGGFVMIGGENSYGVGGYYRTPIEQMLPVRMEHEDRQDTPSVALLVVLDRSGSMTAQVQGQTKMSLANQGAVFAMNALQPKDFFGVLAVDTRAHTVAPLAQLSAKGTAEQKIMSVTAGGGGIYIYTSLAEAFQSLRDVQARIKHVILFSDAADAEEKIAGEMGDGTRAGGSSLDLASAMLSAKITTSVVALGTEQDKDTTFLRQLAERGSGRFYLTSDATTLPQIFSTETMKVAQSSLVEEPFLAAQLSRNPILAGLDWAQSPLLLGYNTTKPKPTAEVLLGTERGEPLLAVWRHGLGQAAAFTSDAKSRWAAEWLQWPGYGKFWTQLVRGLMRKTDQSAFQINTRTTGDRLTILVDAVTPDGAFRNQLPIQVAARQPDGETVTMSASQEAPGSYRADFTLPTEGTTIFSITSPELPDGGTVFGHTRSYPREFLALEPNETLLRQMADIGGGRFAPSPNDVFSAPAKALPLRRDLTDWFLIGALVLLPIDIWLRRRSWN